MSNDAQINMLCKDDDEPVFIGKDKNGDYEIDIDPTELRCEGWSRRVKIPGSLFWTLHHSVEGYHFAQRLMKQLYDKAE